MKTVIVLLVCLASLAAATGAAAQSDVLYSLGEPTTSGTLMGANMNNKAMVQPFQVRKSGWASQIGVAIASGSDPNGAGFLITLTDTNMAVTVPGTTVAGPWNILPENGASWQYVYADVPSIFLDTNKIYGLLIEPGDGTMYGSVAFSRASTAAGYFTSNNWASAYSLPSPVCIRIYGTLVPEPSSALALLCGTGGIAGAMLRRKKAKF